MPLTRDQRRALPAEDFALPAKRALPIVDARHCRMAAVQIMHAAGLTDAERDEAKARIIERAKTFGLDLAATQASGLYVRRNLTAECAAEFVAWAKSQGFINIMAADQLHVTIVYSSTAVALEPLGGEVKVVGGDRDVVPLGDAGAIVLRFASDALQQRWVEARAAGATGYDEFLQHVTISWGGEPADNLDNVEPFGGDLVFGPEIHEPLNPDWKETGMRMEASAFLLDGEGLEAMALAMPEVAGHPNRMPFSGILTRLDAVSDRAPGGSNGKKVILTKAAAERALNSLIGMAVDFTPNFDGHDAVRKFGVITAASIEGDAIHVGGHIYARDFPKEASRVRTDKALLGMSWELADIYVESPTADPLVITDAYFTGAAILRKDKAAYHSTSLAAKAEDPDMTKEEIAAIVAESVGPAVVAAMKPISDAQAALATTVGEMQAAGEKSATERAEAERATADKAKDDQLAAMTTRIADLEAAAAKTTEAPERKTLPPHITALLAKADLSMPDGDGKLQVGAVDAALTKAGLTPVKRMEIKGELSRAGAL